MPLTMEQMEQEINALHAVLEERGVNSRKTADIFGREFELPVNSEHKATVCNGRTICSMAQPHMRTFWAATIGFFSTFFSCFAPAALGVYYKKPPSEGGLGLSLDELKVGGNLAVTGTILMRVAAGPMCDTWGARKTFILLLLLGLPGMLLFMAAQNAFMFILGRVLIGLSLATFVTCQVWCSQFFDRSIVGKVNATAGGWGNLGGGITLLTMPFIMEFFLSLTGSNIGTSWRLCMIVPMIMHLGSAWFISTGRDLPDGSYKQLETAGAKQKSKGAGGVAKLGFSNTNALIMLVTYGLCFGVELTMNNKLVPYFWRYYGMAPTVAGPLGACFSLMNIMARSWGGCLSDACAKKFGIRGRITAMWVIQTLEGFMCILMGLVTLNYDGPDEPKFAGAAKVMGLFEYGGYEYIIDDPVGQLGPCSSDLVRSPAMGLLEGVSTALPVKAGSLIMIKDPAASCVHNQNTLMTTMICMLLFSVCVQMAEGLHFGIVPYISRPALGVVSGMVGAGGNAGALLCGTFIFGPTGAATMDGGFIVLGVTIIILSMLMHFIFFPGEGGILLPPSFPYDPQLIKEPAGAKGSDQLDFTKTDTKSGGQTLAA